MSERVGLLNGENITFDHDFSAPMLAVLKGGILSGLEVTNDQIAKGSALIEVERANGQKILVHFENTTLKNLDTSGSKKVFIEVKQDAVDDGSNNNEDGSEIAEIKSAPDFPSKNFIKLASINDGNIEDERIFSDLKNEELTRMGNEFNQSEKLVKLDIDGKLPNLDGSRLTNLASESNALSENFIAGEDLTLSGESLIVGVKADLKVYLYDDETPEEYNILGSVKESYSSGEEAKVYFSGMLDGFQNLEVGNDYFATASTNKNEEVRDYSPGNHSTKKINIGYRYNQEYAYKFKATSSNSGEICEIDGFTIKIKKYKYTSTTLLAELYENFSIGEGFKNKIAEADYKDLVPVDTGLELNHDYTFSGKNKVRLEVGKDYYIRFYENRVPSSSDVNYQIVVNNDYSRDNYHFYKDDTIWRAGDYAPEMTMKWNSLSFGTEKGKIYKEKGKNGTFFGKAITPNKIIK